MLAAKQYLFFNDAARLCYLQCLLTFELRYQEHFTLLRHSPPSRRIVLILLLFFLHTLYEGALR